MDFSIFLIQCLNALQYGLLLFLVASGLTLIFGIMGVINLAHGSFYMIGAYMAFGLAPIVQTAFGGGFAKGKHDENVRQQVEIAALNAKARETEQNMAKVANTYADTLRKSQNVAKSKETKLRADIATGNLRLSIPTQSSTVCPSTTAASASGSDSGEARTELSGSVSETLISIASEGDAAIRKLN
ncbi:MAG: hypothetical protein EBW74_13065, partial [Betaproteobacteria bacterium]|nr:hypothetical protein [Betaproteobacteria bacterium]